MALANAAAAAELAEPATSLNPLTEPEGNEGDVELLITLSRSPDGSLGLLVGSDDEGRAIVKVGRADVEAGDVIISLGGTDVPTLQRYEQELVHIYATGVEDSIRLKVLRPPASSADVVEFSAESLKLAAGEQHHIPLVAREPSLGTYTFACLDDGRIDWALCISPPQAAVADAATVATHSSNDSTTSHVAATAGEGTFHVFAAGDVVHATIANTSSSTISMQVSISLTSVSEALAAEFRRTGTALTMQQTHLDMLSRHEEGLRNQELELERRLSELRASRTVAREIWHEDAGVFEALQASHERLIGCFERRPVLTLASVAGDGGSEGCEAGEGTSGQLKVDAHAAIEALSASRLLRVEAFEGRRSLHGRAYQKEELLMRAQVINFLPSDEERGDDTADAR